MTNINTKPRRGRPRAFDEQAVIQHAQQIFLKHGFEAVSYEQLASEVGLSKPSLYNAFGDKSALFERVLDNYAQEARSFSVAEFESGKTLEEGTKKLLLLTADIYCKPDTLSEGCLLVGTALPACSKSGNIQQILAKFIQLVEADLEGVIAKQYYEDAQFLDRAPRALAVLISSLVFSLAIRARTGVPRQELRATASELAGSLFLIET
ncbi:MAG: TetR/AcrR family transcriptional regulator [bacterium]|nr:TetR/AcrR family transcriptional regulator [bacterium]